MRAVAVAAVLWCALGSARAGTAPVTGGTPTETSDPAPEAAPAKAAEDTDHDADRKTSVDDPVTRESEALETKYDAWGGPGFRVWIEIGYGYLAGTEGVPSMHSVATAFTLGWRFNEWLGLTGTLRYTVPVSGFTGVRWSATVEPVLFFGDGFMASVGVGYGGLLGARPFREDAPSYNYALYVHDPDRIAIAGDDTEVVPAPPFPSCDGDGGVALARTAYLITVGDLFATGPVVQGDAQLTQCVDHAFEAHVPLEARHTIPKQWWVHFTVEAGWLVAWR